MLMLMTILHAVRRARAVQVLTALLIAQPLSAAGAELVFVERTGCAYCAKWDREIGSIYPLTDEAQRMPLRRLDLVNGQPTGSASPVRFTPTFIVMHDGREVGRITGYISDTMFWGMLSAIEARIPAKLHAASD